MFLYNINDKVMVFNNSNTSSKKPRKLAMDWSDPWSVTNILSKTRYNLKNCSSGKELTNMHSYHLKPFFE
ncbi:hypothetical protein BDF21DRAFT_433075 [Thamnidium elegans]|nr:hypothetical protein BDF21DRAFT_433075 [Thamnidium elegans]